MKERTKSSIRKVVIGALLGAIIVLAVLLYLGSTVPLEQEMEEEEAAEEIVEEVMEETTEEPEAMEEETTEEEAMEEEITGEVTKEIEEEEVTYGISFDYVLSKDDCKCYSIDEEIPEGNLDCKLILGLIGCSDAGVPVKAYMLDEEGNIEEQYLDDLGLA